MDPAKLLQSLNEAQQEAVKAPLTHQLILAGAGSGKTRVLVHRLAWLIEVEKISPFHLMAVTFTNKAANEMKARIAQLTSLPTREMWVGTFHGLSHRLLRKHWQEAGLLQSFQILDDSDQYRIIRRVIESLNIDEERFPAKEAQWFINAQKEKGLDPNQVAIEQLSDRTYIKIYEAYADTATRAGVIDFADLLLKSIRLLQSHESLRMHYQNRFRAILVDEFQDTNAIQYQWLKLLTGNECALMVVGDDDQSIYGWRGAEIKNIRHFSQDFPAAQFIRLEQNYRSTHVILDAANALIAQNTSRLGKNLWTEDKAGEPIIIYTAYNDIDEAQFVIRQIEAGYDAGFRNDDFAILYRSNAQSRLLEEVLMQRGIPYRIYGGLRFFDRAEIKSTLAYLRLIVNPNDDTSFERIINFPARGIGERTLALIRETATTQNQSLMTSLKNIILQSSFSGRTQYALESFVTLIEQLTKAIESQPLSQQIETVISQSGLLEHYHKEKGEKGLNRVENLEELVNAAYQFTQDEHSNDNDTNMSLLTAFLNLAALEGGGEDGQSTEGVQLMTLHAAKGLEFPIVFIVGCEEQLFPHFLSMDSPKQLEEERRLCYVGMTRAMKKLILTHATTRMLHGKKSYHRPSRFLKEIPEELIQTEQVF